VSAKYNWNYQTREDEMVRGCSINREEEERRHVISQTGRRKVTTRNTKTYVDG
jgi:hypothetical protein